MVSALPPQPRKTPPTFDESGTELPSDVVAFAVFMRFLAAPTPSVKGITGNPSASSIANRKTLSSQIHCDTCHTPCLKTNPSKISPSLSNQTAALYSDLLVHNMGSGLADIISQGSAGPDEFRTAPLWGLGQRIFFLHDGRSGPANGGLVHAIAQHASSGSEANRVNSLYNNLTSQQKQDLLNFLRRCKAEQRQRAAASWRVPHAARQVLAFRLAVPQARRPGSTER